jgi:UDP-N-acetylmuramoyl-L-alanyl-D-glutamate--2,6-diaminopimelate ligase
MLELNTPDQAAQWLHSHVSGALQTDSRKIRPGDGFIAWPGAATDGRRFVADALAKGAKACLVERQGSDAYALPDEQLAVYADLKAASGPIAASYFEQPSRQLDVLAVTGTNGKTSTSWWLAQSVQALKPAIAAGLMGTLGIGRVPAAGSSTEAVSEMVSNGLTTPDPVLLQQALRHFADVGIKVCAIEASSIGIEEHRLDGTQIHTAIFTNFTQDHLDYHGSMETYWKAKAALFDWPGLVAAVINIDDAAGAGLAQTLSTRALDLWTISCASQARLRATDIRTEVTGLHFTVREDSEQYAVATQLFGLYNVSNLLGVMGGMRALGIPLAQVVKACQGLHPVPGRMEIASLSGVSNQPLAVVDYAHTPDALAKVLQALRPVALERGGKLWCIFGCGGDRDPIKRPLMGAIAGQHADEVVLTSDNPRSEKADAIISQILLGLEGATQVTVQADRARAIAQTLQLAASQDVVLVAGKGHEDYQEIAGQRLAFSDRAEILRALQTRMSAGKGQTV